MTNQQLRESSHLGLLTVDHIQAKLGYWDKDQICRFANRAYIDWFGKTKEEMIDKMTLKELLGPIYEKNIPYIKEVLKSNHQQFEREIKTPKGEIRYAMADYYPDIVRDEVRGFYAYVSDVSRNKKLERELSASELP